MIEWLLVISQVLTPIGVLLGVWVSWDNKRRINEVTKSTNGLAQRNEQIANDLGRMQGAAAEQANPTPQRKPPEAV